MLFLQGDDDLVQLYKILCSTECKLQYSNMEHGDKKSASDTIQEIQQDFKQLLKVLNLIDFYLFGVEIILSLSHRILCQLLCIYFILKESHSLFSVLFSGLFSNIGLQVTIHCFI